jgi:TnpA family transposase
LCAGADHGETPRALRASVVWGTLGELQLLDGPDSHALRREIHEALNVVENWNSANSFIFFGKGGEVATNRLEDQKLSVLALHLLQAPWFTSIP